MVKGASQTKMSKCVFCGESATKINEEQQPVCRRHKEREPKELACPDCGMPMKIKKGNRGFFWGCEGYPTCHKTFDITEKLDPETEE